MNLLSAFFEDLARIEDQSAHYAEALVRDTEVPVWLTDQRAADRLRQRLAADGDVDALKSVIKELVHVAIHSVLVAIDGGSSSAEVGRVHLADDAGASLGEGLHEAYVEYLFATDRRPQSSWRDNA